MSKLWDEVRQEGRMEGRAEGRAEGKAEEIVSMGEEFQLPREAILKRLQEKLGVGIQQAEEYFKRFAKGTAAV